ncbi:MAG: phage Gp37/Gp68 family protein [Pseudomonadota bacterium]
MGEGTNIEWADATFNPWEGCQKVGPGCDHCYAEARNARFGGGVAGNWGLGAPRRRTSTSNWRKPLHWQDDAARFFAANGRRQRVFCASLADVFDNAVHPDWRSDLFELIQRTPDLDWLLLTKRIGNVERMIWDDGEMRALPPHVWLGATIVNQAEADRDIPKLLATPAAKRFLSMEPLLGPVDLTAGLRRAQSSIEYFQRVGQAGIGRSEILDWVIVGGESGPGARPMHPDWARSLRDQCAEAGVPFLFKQWGSWREAQPGDEFDTAKGRANRPPAFIVKPDDGSVHCFLPKDPDPRCRVMIEVGKNVAGRLLDGVQHDAVPE